MQDTLADLVTAARDRAAVLRTGCVAPWLAPRQDVDLEWFELARTVQRAADVAKRRLLESLAMQTVLPAQELVSDERRQKIEVDEVLGLRLHEPRLEDVGHAGEAELLERACEFDCIH